MRKPSSELRSSVSQLKIKKRNFSYSLLLFDWKAHYFCLSEKVKLNSGLPFRADTESADIITKFFSGYDRAVRPGSGKGIVSRPAACQNN